MVTAHILDRRPRASIAMLEQVEARLQEELLGRDLVTFAPVHAIALASSKRIRATLVLASAGAVRTPAELAVQLAVAVEIVHTFSLVHDDIEDGASMRRGHAAVHVAEGTPVAINAGDALHALAWSTLLALDAPAARLVDVARLFSGALDRMVSGQARDLVWTRDRRTDLAIDDYVAMVRGKSGALLGFAAAAPAAVVGQPSVAALYSFGEQLGITLQILDDVASLRGTAQRLGKPVGSSANGAGSAPALLASAHDDGTAAAIALARKHAARALDQLHATELVHDDALVAFVQSTLSRLLDACGANDA